MAIDGLYGENGASTAVVVLCRSHWDGIIVSVSAMGKRGTVCSTSELNPVVEEHRDLSSASLSAAICEGIPYSCRAAR